MRKIAFIHAAAVGLAVWAAHAQPTQQSLDAEINQLLPSNNRNAITAAELRQVLQDMVSATFSLQVRGSLHAKDVGASGSNASTTGTIAAGSNSLAVAGAGDFVNGQGIRISHAGAPFAASSPAGLSVTPTGTTGSTSYSYTIAAIDAAGGIGAAIGTVSTSTGNAALSTTNYNALSWSAGGGTKAYAVYGRTAGSLVLLGITSSTSFNDVGAAAVAATDSVPGTPPAVALADWLVTSIISGGGGTTLTLFANAITTVSSQTVAHDDTVALGNWIGQCQTSGLVCFLDEGNLYVSSTLAVSSAVRIEGVALATSTIWAAGGGVSVINISTANAVVFRTFGIQYARAAYSGTYAIELTAPSGQNYASLFQGMFIGNAFYGFELQSAVATSILNNWISGSDAATNLSAAGIYFHSLNSCTIGDHTVAGNYIAIPGPSIGVLIDCGAGFKIEGNKIVGNDNPNGYGIQLTLAAGAPNLGPSDLQIIGNSIENFIAGVLLRRQGTTQTFYNLQINDNEFSGAPGGIMVYAPTDATGIWLKNATIGNNSFYAAVSGTNFGISIDTISAFTVENNVYIGNGGTDTAFNIGSGAAGGSAVNNVASNVSTVLANASSSVASISPVGNGWSISNIATNNLQDVTAGTSWTPSDQSGAGLVFTGVSAGVTKLGNMVFVYGTLTYPTTANGSNALIGGLPYTAANQNYQQVGVMYDNAGLGLVAAPVKNTTTFAVLSNGAGANQTNAALSTHTITFSLAYTTQ